MLQVFAKRGRNLFNTLDTDSIYESQNASWYDGSLEFTERQMLPKNVSKTPLFPQWSSFALPFFLPFFALCQCPRKGHSTLWLILPLVLPCELLVSSATI